MVWAGFAVYTAEHDVVSLHVSGEKEPALIEAESRH